MSQLHEVKDRLRKKLKRQPGVVGVGITMVNRNSFNVNAIKVNFRNRDALVKAELPSETEGVPIVVEVVGQIRVRQA